MEQFDWENNWSRVERYLEDADVQDALDFGMRHWSGTWRRGDPPWEIGRGPINGQEANPGELSWYQPYGRCHWISPFSWAIGQKLYPELKWGFLTSDVHTVAVGFNGEEIEVVMDILLFKMRSAEESIERAKGRPWVLCFTPEEVFPDCREIC